MSDNEDNKEEWQGNRSSARIRNRSAKNSTPALRNPEFIYSKVDSEEVSLLDNFTSREIEEEGRARAASWSSTGGVAVVELRRKLRGRSKQDKEQLSASTSCLYKLSDKRTTKIKRSKKEEVKVDIEETVELQPKISDVFKTNKESEARKDKRLNKQVKNFSENRETTLLSSKAAVSTLKATGGKSAANYFACYGSDFEDESVKNLEVAITADITEVRSASAETSGINITTGKENLNSPELEAAANSTKMALTEDSLKALLETWKNEIMVENKTSIERAVEESVKSMKEELSTLNSFKTKVTTDVSQLQSDVLKLTNDLTKVKTDLQICQVKLAESSGASVRQQQMIEESKDDIEEMKGKMNRDQLRIRGIVENKDEDCVTKVGEFFKNILEIEKNIEIVDAFRVGQGKNRPILVFLKNSRDKKWVFGNVKKLADVTNELNNPYNISDQLTAKKNAERNRRRQVVRKNKDTAGEQLAVAIERNELKVEGSVYKKAVQPPPLRRILLASNDERRERLKIDPVKGNSIWVEHQEFIAFTAAVRTLEEVNNIYTKLRALYTDARHIVCAFNLPHRLFHTHQDFFDDDEHSGGAFLLQLLTEANIVNRVLFVVRRYNGTHIGSKRYDAMRNAVKSALTRAGKNPITGNFDMVWDRVVKTPSQYSNQPIRGRGRGYKGGQLHDRQKEPRVGDTVDIDENTTEVTGGDQAVAREEAT